jgi:imidazolonepropionase-like amidohydrolase
MTRALCALALLGAAAAAAPPSRDLPADLRDPACVALAPLTGAATVLMPEGLRVGDTAILVAGGRIARVDRVGALPRDGAAFVYQGARCATIDITGKHVIPGLVEVASQIGLVEVGLEGATSNVDAGRDDPVRASLRVADAYDPRSVVIPEQRVEGVLSAVTAPTGGAVSGQAAYVDLAGATQAEAIVSPSVAMIAGLGGSSRAESLRQLRELLLDARAYQRNRAAFERNAFRPLQAHRLDLDALAPVVDGRLPLVVGADRAADIEALLRLQRELGIKLVIQGGAEAWIHADALAAAGVPVIVDPFVYGPGGFDQVAGRRDNAALLHRAGVPVILSTFSTHNARTLRQVAGNAAREGLPRDAALRAVTTTPARVFGGADRGEIAAGQVANLAVFDGDPMELLTSTTHALIRGRPIPLDSRQWRLTLRYLDLPGTPPMAAP